MKKDKDMALYVLMALENQLFNAVASEYQEDILKVIQEELAEVQAALTWVRSKKN